MGQSPAYYYGKGLKVLWHMLNSSSTAAVSHGGWHSDPNESRLACVHLHDISARSSLWSWVAVRDVSGEVLIAPIHVDNTATPAPFVVR